MNVVVIGWPSGQLEAAAFDRAVTTCRAGGAEVTEIDLFGTGFRASMSPAERAAYHQPEPIVDEAVGRHAAAVRRAEMLVFVYPSAASTLPAPLKGWLERVLLPGVAFVFDDHGRVKPGLTHVRRLVGIATYAERWPTVKARNDNGRRILLRALRLNTGMRTRSSWVALYAADRADAAARDAFLRKVERTVVR